MKKKIFISILSVLIVLCNLKPVFASQKNSTPSGIEFSEIEAKIDEHVNKYIGKTTPGAAIAVVKDGDIIFSKGYGYRDIEKKMPIDPKTTVFEYASISKLFVWTSVMQLVEQGKLNLNEDIKKYLPSDFSSKLKYKKPITMNNLMSHKAGFGDYVIDLSSNLFEPTISLEKALIKFEPKQVYEPGGVSAYSNYGAALAGYVVENVSGEKLSTYEEKNIFIPSKMNNASADATEKFKRIKATGYIGNENFKIRNWFNMPLYPAGGGNGTLEDLTQFAIALTPKTGEDTVLFKNRTTLDNMLTESNTMNYMPLSFNHGFIESSGEKYTLGHGGNNAGFSSYLAVVPSESLGVVVLTNAWSEVGITSGIVNLLTNKKGIKDHTNREATIDTNTSNEGLPSSKEVEGSYVTSRIDYENFLEFRAYLETISIKSPSENKIELSIEGFKESYVQIKPGIYELIETQATNDFFKRSAPLIYFNIKDNKVDYLSFGPSFNFKPLPTGKTIPWLILSIAVLVASLVYFIISPIALLIQKLINNKKKRGFLRGNIIYKRVFVALNLCGTLTLLNNIVLFSHILSDYFSPSSILNPHIILNWVLLGFTIILTSLLLLKYKKANLSKKQKIFSIITITLVVLFMWLLINWNFLSILK